MNTKSSASSDMHFSWKKAAIYTTVAAAGMAALHVGAHTLTPNAPSLADSLPYILGHAGLAGASGFMYSSLGPMIKKLCEVAEESPAAKIAAAYGPRVRAPDLSGGPS